MQVNVVFKSVQRVENVIMNFVSKLTKSVVNHNYYPETVCSPKENILVFLSGDGDHSGNGLYSPFSVASFAMLSHQYGFTQTYVGSEGSFPLAIFAQQATRCTTGELALNEERCMSDQ